MKKRTHSFLVHAAMLLLCMLTTMGMWAEDATPLNSLVGLKKVSMIATKGSGLGTYEGCQKLFDDDVTTKWCRTYFESLDGSTQGVYVEFNSAEAFVPKGYSLSTANDNSQFTGRNPISWKLKAKETADGDWVTIVEVTDDNTLQDVNYTQYNFAIPSSVTTAYQYYRFEVTASHNSKDNIEDIMQMSELKLWRTADASEPTYTITLPTDDTYGSVTALVEGVPSTTAYKDDNLQLVFSWNDGCELYSESFSIKDENDNNVNIINRTWLNGGMIYFLKMPASNITVNAEFGPFKYMISYPEYTREEEGEDKLIYSVIPSVNDTDVKGTFEGETVTLTLTTIPNIVIDDLKVSYKKKSEGGEMEAPRRASRANKEDRDKCYLELTKVDDTHYTFIMPDADVWVETSVHYEGKYAISIAPEINSENLRVSVYDIDAQSANEGDNIWLYTGTEGVDNLSITGVPSESITDHHGGNYSFVMPAHPITISADLKFRLFYVKTQEGEKCSLAVSVDGNAVEPDDYVAPGKIVTLTVASTDKNLMVSYLRVRKSGDDYVPLTQTGDNTYTFVMPGCGVTVDLEWGLPVTLSFNANGGEGSIDDVIKGDRGYITMPTCTFTREGYTFLGWQREGNGHIYLEGEDAYFSGNTTFYALWMPTNGVGDVITNSSRIEVPSLDYPRDLSAPADAESADAIIDGTPVDLYTLCLPYAPATGAGIKYYTLSGSTDSSLQFEEISGDPVANTPYLVAVSDATSVGGSVTEPVELWKRCKNFVRAGDYAFVGTTIGVTNAEAAGHGIYILQSGNKWRQVDSSNTTAYIPPFRAFIIAVTYSSRTQLDGDFGEPTGLQSIQLIDRDGTERWYDLNGHRIDTPMSKGLYIANGRKVVIK